MRHKTAIVISVFCAAILVFVLPQSSPSQSADPPPPPSLKTVPVPEPPNISDFVQNRQLAIALGKALFWDMQVGSDGIVACATCHFHAGADSRSINQLNPGANRVMDFTYTPNPDRTIDKGANAQLTASDFPFHKLADPTTRTSPVLSDTNDVVSSQGVSDAIFVNSTAGNSTDATVPVPDPDGFQVGGVNVRRVQPRNAPSVINAVFNYRNFWDGRAQNLFNGVNHLGDRDPNARLYRSIGLYDVSEVQVRIPNASLASQAVAPPVNRNEQSAAGRTFSDIAERFSFALTVGSRRALSLRPLGKQLVAKDDSVLGPYSRYPQPGLTFNSYQEMIAAAFQPAWWASAVYIHVNDDGSRTVQPITGLPGDNDFLQIQYNFSLFFGLSVQMYESTLVSNDSPFDRYMEGKSTALTALQKQGLGIFLSQTRGRCINCHTGPEFTEASYSVAGAHVTRRREEQMIDTGFFNIGIRPAYEDPGIGGDDATNANQPLSVARLSQRGLFVDPNLSPPLSSTDVFAIDGAFKVPSLRNVELTAPYFHNGGQGTLAGVIDFYSRGGGDFFPIEGRDGTITPVRILNLNASEKSALLAFLLALTDDRVRYQQAPFDHPQIFVPNGEMGNTFSVQTDSQGQAVDRMMEIPAVGKKGGTPPKNFLE